MTLELLKYLIVRAISGRFNSSRWLCAFRHKCERNIRFGDDLAEFLSSSIELDLLYQIL